MDMFLLYILFYLSWPIILIGLILHFVRRRKKGVHPGNDKEWYLRLALSKEDAVSQSFLLLAVFFLGVTLLAFNRDLSDPFSWQTILFVTSVVGLVSAYYLKVLYTLAFGLVGVGAWWGAQAAEWVQGVNIKSSAVFVGLAFIALIFFLLGHLHEQAMKWKRFSLVYLVLGIVSTTGILFFFSMKPGLSVLGDMTKGASFIGSWQITLSLLIFFAAIVGAAIYGVARKLLSIGEFLSVLFLVLLFGMIALLPEQSMFLQTAGSYNYYYGNQELSSAGVVWAIIFNIVLFFELLGLIFSGYVRQETWLVNLGALFLFLLIIVKYFDWFFTFLDKSVFFIGAGILLFAVGWFMERGRRYMIANMSTHSVQSPQ